MDFTVLRTDPEFRKLNYDKQRSVYGMLLKQALMKDSEFQSLDPQKQSAIYQSLVMGWKPALNAYDGTLTDQDRQALRGGFLADVPGTQDSYKRALWLRERLDAGDATAVDEAQGWIVRNSVGTKSLLVQAAAGVKDAIETLFGGDPMFNDLRLNSQDYQKLSTYLLEAMPSAKAKRTRTLAGVAGTGAAIVENVGLNFLLGGTMMAPGLFTKRLWAKAAAKTTAELSMGKVTLATALREPIITGISGGVIDIVRTFPRLVETGVIQGPKDALVGMASTFGEGFAFDFVAQGAKLLFRTTVVPMREAFRRVNPTDPSTIARVAEAMKELDAGKFSYNLASMLNPNSPPEVLKWLSPEMQQQYIRNSMRVKAMLNNPEVEFMTEGGLKKLAFAMGGWDAAFNKAGGVNLMDDAGKLVKSTKSAKEAFSWMLAQGPNGMDDITDLSKAMTGGSVYGRLKVYGQTTTHVSDLPDKHLIQMTRTTSFRSGAVDQKSFKASMGELLRRGKLGASTKINFIDEDEFLTRFGSRPPWETGGTKWTFWKKGEELYIPKTVTKEGTTKALTDYLQPIYSKFGAEATSLPLTVDGLNAAMTRIGGKVTGVQGKWQLWMPGKATPLDYSEVDTLNRDVWGALLESGAVDVDEFNELLMKSTGYYVKVDTDDITGLPLYTIRSGSTVLQTSSTLKGLSDSAVLYNLRLPEDLLPDMMIGTNGNIIVSTTMATGTPRSLLRYLQNFKEGGKYSNPLEGIKEGRTVKRTLADGSEAVLTYGRGKKIIFENPATGTVKEFGTNVEFTDFLEKLDGTWRELDALGTSKGFRAKSLPNGGILFTSAEGSYTTKNYDEAVAFLQKQPSIALDMPELVSIYGKDADKVLFDALNKPFDDDLELIWKNRTKVLDTDRGEAKNLVDLMIKPGIDRVKQWAVRYNAPYLTDAINAWEAGRVMYGSKRYRDVNPLIKNLFTDESTNKLLSTKQRHLMSQLLERDESTWGTILKNGVKDHGDDVVILKATKRAKNLLEAYGKTFNIDILGFMQNYVPHLRDHSAEAIADALANNTRYSAIKTLFGKTAEDLPIIKFLSRNSRLDSLIDSLQETDALKIVEFYVGRGYRDLYLKPASDMMADAVKRFANEHSGLENVITGLKDTYGAMVGGVDDSLGRSLSSASLDATRHIARGLEKISGILGGDTTNLGRKFEELSKRAVTADMVGGISQNLSLATLGFRYFRALSNTAQYVNTIAIYGRYGLRALEEVDDSVIFAYRQRGILDDKIFASFGDQSGSIKKTFADIAFKPQQSSEHLTRAWTAKAAQDAFDDFLPGLRAGNYDFTKFVKLAKLGYLSDGSIQTIQKLLAAGSIDAARDYAMRQAIRELMFDYTKENAPHLFTGTMGRLFGKFGVYPAGQINLYRNIIRGFADDPGEAFLQVSRLVASAAIVRNAFLAVGIDYGGFKLTDPFSFQGGPLWATGLNVMALGDDGPRGDLARRDLMRNWLPIAKKDGRLGLNIPRLALPGGLQIQSTLDGFKKAFDEDYWGAFLDFWGAPGSRTTWTKPVLPF